MTKEVIYIDNKNCWDYLNLDVIAFSFAYGGAQGSGGEILVITKVAKMYSMNYVWGDMTIEMCYEVCPPLKDCEFGVIDVEKTPNGWKGIGLGLGNFLVLAEPIYNQIGHELLKLRPPFRYREWRDMVLETARDGMTVPVTLE